MRIVKSKKIVNMKNIYLGNNPFKIEKQPVSGEIILIRNEKF